MNQLTRVTKFKKFYTRYGWNGIKYLLKTAIKINGIIEYVPKSYRHPIFLRNNTTDVDTFSHIFQGLDYDIDLGYKPEVIIDCGANAGFATVFFKNKYPGSTVIAVEPEDSNYNMLLKNTERYSNIFCLRNGIWNKSTNLEIIDSGQGKWGFTVQEVEHENQHTVKAISLQEIMQLYKLEKIDLLKIDIEGAERNLFEQNYEAWLPYTKCIIIELHNWIMNDCAEVFYKAMSHFKYRKIVKGENVICIMEGN